MRRNYLSARALLCVISLFLMRPPTAMAHGIVGKRMFIEPLVTEDANVKNELDLPSAEFLVQPNGTWRTIGFSFEKATYPHRFSFVLSDSRVYQHVGASALAGWDNFETGLKWEAYTNVAHELVLSPALFMSFPTGTERVIPQQTALRPEVAYGKGFGDLATGWLRPFALQGDFGYQASVTGPRDRELDYDEVVMYSIPYLNRWVRNADAGYSLEHNLRQGFSRSAFFGDLYPYVEFNASTPIGGTSGGTSSALRPGVLWMGKYAQVSLAADIPIQQPGIAPRHAGAFILVDWFLDELFPRLSWTPFGKRKGARWSH